MKFTRRHTDPEISPYVGAGRSVGATMVVAAGSPLSAISDFPTHWSSKSQEICREQCFVAEGVSCDLVQIAEDDVPHWLWRSEPAETTIQSRGETSLCEVIDRVCGGWTYQGWKGGYFDTEDDARAFFDETRWLLFHQNISPSLNQWRHAGRYWAYGHDVSVPSTYLTDYRNGKVRRAEQNDLPPLSMVINTADNSLAGEGGVWDLWRREGDILSNGGNCGANISDFEPARSPNSTTTFNNIISVGDSMAKSVVEGACKQMQRRRLTIDALHPESHNFAKRNLAALTSSETGVIGTTLARRHIQAIIDTCAPSERGSKQDKHASSGLRLALQSARQALLPEALIERAIKLAEAGLASSPDHVMGEDGQGPAAASTRSQDRSITVIRIEDVCEDGRIPAASQAGQLVDSVAASAWSGIESGLHFGSNSEAWNTCPASGPVRCASGDGSYMFLDDTASDPWLINAASFQPDHGEFDIAGYQNAVEIATIAADLSLMTTSATTPRLAHRVWDFRPISISPTGLGQCLASAGIAYDSSAGRAFGASLGALLTSTAYRCSARMAAELGQFPEFAKNADDMLRVLNQHGDMVANCSHHSSTTDLVEIIESTWLEALEIGSQEGFRNAQVSVLCDAPDLTTLIGCDAFGVSPNDGLLTDKKTPAGYYEKGVSSFVAQGLNKLGYSETQIADIVRHIAGHGTLEDAPGVNHETLRKRGFTAAAIDAVENALSCSNDITLAFNPFVLGEDYCRHMLGFTVAEFNDDNFDMLAGLGFSDAGIEAATIYCCGAGTMEGAPHLAPEHLAIFDCLVQQGVRGQRCVTTTSIVKMMAALTPHISGAIGQTLQVPAEISLGDYRTILELAHRLKLKSITLRRIPADLELFQPVSDEQVPENHPVPAFAVIQGGQSIPQLNEYISEEAETRIPLSAITRSDVSDDMEISPDVAKASRRALSHAARSSASVSSSADALVEQRHV